MNCLFYGDSIAPGTQPVLVFPVNLNYLLANIALASSIQGSVTVVDGQGGPLIATDSEVGTIGTPFVPFVTGYGAAGYLTIVPIAGQLSNLNIKVSKDGGAFITGVGVFAEVGNGYYSYIPATTETDNPPTPNSSNTGTVAIRIYPTNPKAVSETNSDAYIEETFVTFRLRAPGTPQSQLSPGSQTIFNELITPAMNDMKKYINQVFGQLLPANITNKPSFKKD